VAVGPQGLNRVTADTHESNEAEGVGREWLVGVFVDIAQDIHLAFATGARTMPAQFLQANEGFGAVIPFHCQFLADLLHVERSHYGHYG